MHDQSTGNGIVNSELQYVHTFGQLLFELVREVMVTSWQLLPVRLPMWLAEQVVEANA